MVFAPARKAYFDAQHFTEVLAAVGQLVRERDSLPSFRLLPPDQDLGLAILLSVPS
jgi:hypothetical protein